MTTLTGWTAPDRLRVSVSASGLDDFDLEQLVFDAAELGWRYHRRERDVIASILLGMAGGAEDELKQRHRGLEEWGDSWDMSLEFDATSNPEQNKDDLGTLMAQAIAMAESQEVSDDLAHLWFGIVRQLARERDRLRAVGVIL